MSSGIGLLLVLLIQISEILFVHVIVKGIFLRENDFKSPWFNRVCEHIAACLYAFFCLRNSRHLPEWLRKHLINREKRFDTLGLKTFRLMTLEEVKNGWLQQIQPGQTGITKLRRKWMNGQETVQSIVRSNPLSPRLRKQTYCISSCKYEGKELLQKPMIQCFVCEQWFHFECVNIEVAPDETTAWLCSTDIETWK